MDHPRLHALIDRSGWRADHLQGVPRRQSQDTARILGRRGTEEQDPQTSVDLLSRQGLFHHDTAIARRGESVTFRKCGADCAETRVPGADQGITETHFIPHQA